MLHLEIHPMDAERNPILKVLGEVGRVSGRRLGRYACSLFGLQERVIAQAEITEYPRWSEPTALLLSRAINAALSEGQDYPCPENAAGYLVYVQLNETRKRPAKSSC